MTTRPTANDSIKPGGARHLLPEAVRAHESGDIERAASLYRDMLTADPHDADALNLLGVAQLQLGKPLEAIELIKKAIASNPGMASFQFNLASSYAAAGEPQTAVYFYRKAIQMDPAHSHAHIRLAELLERQGDLDGAVTHYTRVLNQQPDNAAVLSNLGNIHHQLNNPDKAVACYRQAAGLDPDFVEPVNNLGNIFLERNLFDEAIACYREVIRKNPDFALGHLNLGNALVKQHNLDDAAAEFAETLRLDPDNPRAHRHLAEIHHRAGKLDKAVEHYNAVLATEPENVEVLNSIGLVFLQTDNLDKAREYLEKALAIDPRHAYSLNSYGNALCRQGNTAAACGYFRRALEVNPNLAEAHSNLGNALKESDDFEEAIDHYREALSLRPDYTMAHLNLGNAYKDSGDFSAAYGRYDAATLIDSDCAEAHLNKGIVLLTLGRFADAWKEYDWRIRMLAKRPGWRRFARPQWDGSPLKGERILVHAEQGIGDTIQFVRYLPLVKAQGGHVILECQPSLVDLLKGLPGIDEIVARQGNDVPDVDFDCHAYLLSLPAIFGTTFRTIPRDIPYIRADETRHAAWREKINPDTFNIGLVWAGNPQHGNDRNRSCKLEDFARLARQSGTTWYSLQKGPAAEQTAMLPADVSLIDHSADLNDFSDTAALVANLDLVITVDTSVAHLAGAMARPTWVLVPYIPDWRWLLDRNDSPWYPTMRLFRQQCLGDWRDAFNDLATELERRVETGKESLNRRYYDSARDAPSLAIGRRFNHASKTDRANILFSTTRMWNPGDEFIHFGLQNLLKPLIGEFNSLIYNRHPNMHGLRQNFDHAGVNVDDAEQSTVRAGYGRRRWLMHRDNSWHRRTSLESVDLAIFAGTPEWLGDMVNPLVEKLVKSTIPTMYLGLGAFEGTREKTFDSLAVTDQLSLIRSLLITVRDETCARILEPLKAVHLPCPALLAAPKDTLRTRKRRIAVSTQGISGSNGQNIDPAVLNYCVRLFRKLAAHYQCGLVCHYIDELDELAPLFGDIMEIHYSCDAKDYLTIYDEFDLTVTTRVHGAGLCASLGIPAFVISHSQRSATAEGFLAELIRPDTALIDDAIQCIDDYDVAGASQRLLSHKDAVRETYQTLLKPALEALGMLKTTS